MQEIMNPIVIGGTGGSGTRIFVTICAYLGCYMGNSSNLNASNDALEFFAFLEKWVNVFLCKHRRPMGEDLESKMQEEFLECVSRHCSSTQVSTEKWGWKNPRSMLILPFIDKCYPRMRFVHVIRDGRDMAYSKNQNQPRKHGNALLDRDTDGLPVSRLSIDFWQKANISAADYGETSMKSRYIRIKYEDICENPLSTLKRLFAFLNVEYIEPEQLSNLIKPSDSIGRWKGYSAKDQEELTKAAKRALERFDYLVT